MRVCVCACVSPNLTSCKLVCIQTTWLLKSWVSPISHPMSTSGQMKDPNVVNSWNPQLYQFFSDPVYPVVKPKP